MYCKQGLNDQLDHYIQSCTKYRSTRESYWSAVINSFNVYVSTYLYNLNESELTCVILGKTPDFYFLEGDWQALFELGAKALATVSIRKIIAILLKYMKSMAND